MTICTVLQKMVVKMVVKDGHGNLSDKIPVRRGVLQGDVSSPLLFACLLSSVFRRIEADDGIKIDAITLRHLGFADDVAVCSKTATQANEQLVQLQTVSSQAGLSAKTKTMVVTKPEKIKPSTEADVMNLASQKLSQVCDVCGRAGFNVRGLRIHKARWCVTDKVRSRKGTLADKIVRLQKKKIAAAEKPQVFLDGIAIDNVYNFTYLGFEVCSDGGC
jgi:hypothetical protein